MRSSINTPILSAKELTVYYPTRRRTLLKAVDGVSLDLYPGEVLGFVGESGCGKSSLGRALIRLHDPTSGTLSLLGEDFLAMRGRGLRSFRKNIQMVFQDPYASLNPRMTIFDALAEPLRAHFSLTAQELSKKVVEALEQVGLREGASHKYPHEFSGGQRQRIAIARALILNPKILIADEPVSSLDVSVQAQVLNLLKEIQKNTGLSMLFISHNLSVVKTISDRIAVMYLGKVVETASRESLFENPQHPYTRALISAVPVPDPQVERERKRIPLLGEIPSAENPPSGCAFNTRCPWVIPKCREQAPHLEPFQNQTHQVACFESGKHH